MNKPTLWRNYGLEAFLNAKGQVPYQRYSNPYKGLFWWLTSRFVRIRDWRKYGFCVSCGKRIEHWNEGDAGHYLAAANCGFLLLFNAQNVHLECKHCNAHDPNHQIGMRHELVRRYGEKVVTNLEGLYAYHRKNPSADKEWTVLEYDTYIKEVIKIMREENMLEGFNEVGLVLP